MEILVCIKQVGDEGEINRFDAHALEEALNLKDQLGGQLSESVTVDVVTVGPTQASKTIKRAFGMGADRGYHIVTEDSEYVSSFVTATRLAIAAKKGTIRSDSDRNHVSRHDGRSNRPHAGQNHGAPLRHSYNKNQPAHQ